MKKTIGIILALVMLFSMAMPVMAAPKEKAPENGSVSAVSVADKGVAADIEAVRNTTRKNASGDKIPSNAHSADFPGILFIWDSKQKDNGYLKVDAAVFEEYESFVLTSKESNTYWDFVISVQDGQRMSDDGEYYVFFIPKVYNNKNINMVFIGGFVEKEVVLPATLFQPIRFYTGSGGPGGFGTEVTDVLTDEVWNYLGGGMTAQDMWWSRLNDFEMNIVRNEIATIAADDGGELFWAWDRAETLVPDTQDGDIYSEVFTFDLTQEELDRVDVENSKFYMVADNAVEVIVNGKVYSADGGSLFQDPGYTGPRADWENWDVLSAFGKGRTYGDKDFTEFLVAGENTVVVRAQNEFGTDNPVAGNPCGLLFAFQILFL